MSKHPRLWAEPREHIAFWDNRPGKENYGARYAYVRPVHDKCVEYLSLSEAQEMADRAREEAFKRGLRKGRAMERAELTEHIQAERMYTDSWKKDAERLREQVDALREELEEEKKRLANQIRDTHGAVAAWTECEKERDELRKDLQRERSAAGRLKTLVADRDAAREELKAAKEDAARWEALANEWMADYDKLKNKYEPMIAVTSAALSPVAEEEGGEKDA